MAIINASGGGVKPKILTTPDGVTDEIAIEKASSGKVKPSSTLGNATADKVLAGSTFTSDSGFAMAGTSTLVTDYEQAQETLQDALFLSDDYNLGALPTGMFYMDVAYGNGVYVAVGCGQNSSESTSTTTNQYAYGTASEGWTRRSFPSSGTWKNVWFVNGTFIVYKSANVSGTSNIYYTSTDGINWTGRNIPEARTSDQLSAFFVAYGKLFYFNSGQTNPKAYVSTDFSSWSQVTLSGIGSFYDITYNPDNNTIYATDYSRHYIYSTTDGQNWITLTTLPSSINSTSGNYSVSFLCAGRDSILYMFTNTNYNRCLGRYSISSNEFETLQTVINVDEIEYTANGIFILTYGKKYYRKYDDSGLSAQIGLPIEGSSSTYTKNPVFIGFASGVYISYAYQKTVYSYYPAYWEESLDRGLRDNDGIDVTNDVLYYLLGLNTTVLTAAYMDGVNSYE